ncbi:hypothetical protein [Methanosarcina barkeri]|nr:hypothetical protein [Methanosarcina barkeri]
MGQDRWGNTGSNDDVVAFKAENETLKGILHAIISVQSHYSAK